MTPNEKIKQVSLGSYLYETEGGAILFGISPETVKFFFVNPSLMKPKIMVLPDKFYIDGNSQVAVEFFLYEFLFVSAEFFKTPRRRLKIVGTNKQLARIREILRITLLGPTDEEMKKCGTSKGIRQMLRKEMEYWHQKDPAGVPYGIDDFIDCQPFDEKGEADVSFDGQHFTHLAKTGENLFTINITDEIDLNFTGEQKPPYPITTFEKVVESTNLGLYVVGSSTGFDPFNPCSGLLAFVQGQLWLIDTPPYAPKMLKAMGISPTQINGGVILTHAHDDHLSLPGPFYQDKKLRVISTNEIFYSHLVKLSAICGLPIAELKGYFDFVPITPSKPVYLPGAQITAHYTFHSVPTIGVTITVIDANGQKKSLVIGGDNISFSKAQELKEAGVINDFRYCKLMEIFTAAEREDVIMAIYDSGGKPLHGAAEDFSAYISAQPPEIAKKLYLTHNNPSKIPEEIRDRVLVPGQFVNLVRGNNQLFDFVKIKTALNLFNPGDEWLSAFLQCGAIKEVPPNTTIITEGSKPDLVYVVLNGILSVLVGDNGSMKKIAELQEGDIAGEMAIIKNTTRNATIITASPVKLFCIPGELFANFVNSHPVLTDKLNQVWTTRSFFQQLSIFSEVSAQMLTKISARVQEQSVSAGTVLIHEDSSSKDCYIIKQGRVSVEKNGKQIAVLERGAIIGEVAALGLQNKRTATVKAIDEIIVYRITAALFKELYEIVPTIRLKLHIVLVERGIKA